MRVGTMMPTIQGDGCSTVESKVPGSIPHPEAPHLRSGPGQVVVEIGVLVL